MENKDIQKSVERSLFASKWLLVPFFYGLMIALAVYAIHFMFSLWHMITDFKISAEDTIMVSVLELVDITMIANLIKMIITGSYTSFVNKHHGESSEKASSGLLKVKMSTSLIGVTAIHLLQTFLVAENVSWDTLKKQLIIHCMFLVGSLILAVIEYLHEKGDAMHKDENNQTETHENH
jgi:uncharacterized protein (TIGR00645 family)